LSPDGTKIIEKRQMHKTILEYAPAGSSETVAGGYHTHVLSDLPEDTDVMLVLTRQPRVPETLGAGAYIFTIDVSGNITVADQPK
jgi:proteasome lid subunit RPN8/RPN11